MEGEEDTGPAEGADQTAIADTKDAGTETAGKEVETEARNMGWVPQSEWRGPADKWRPAEEFVQRGREILPIIRAREKAKDAKIAELEKRIGSHASDFKRLERMTEAALNRQREQIEAKYADRMEAAVETGDKDAYRAAQKEQKQALAELDEKTKPEPEKKPEGGLSPEDQNAFEDWQDENTWFNVDKEMTAFADRRFERVKRTNPDISFAEALLEVRKAVEEKFPDKLGKAGKPSRGPSVEGGSRVPGGGAPDKLASKLPAEAKAQALKYVKDGLYKTVEEYAEVYFQ